MVQLDRYSVEEKVAIAREHLIGRVRQRYGYTAEQIFFDPEKESGLLRYLVRTYTHEAGIRELERIIRTLFLRIGRKDILARELESVKITRMVIKKYLEPPRPFRVINDEDRVGEAMGLGVNVDLGLGSLIPIQTTVVPRGGEGEGRTGYLSMVHATGNIQKIMDESRKVAGTAILHCARELEIDLEKAGAPVHIHFMGASTPKDGPSAGIAIALALASVLIRAPNSQGCGHDRRNRYTGKSHPWWGGLDLKLETSYDAGCKTMLIPRENLLGEGSIEKLTDALRDELQVLSYEEWKQEHKPFDRERHVLQVVAVDHILQAADVAFIRQEELDALEACFRPYANSMAAPLAKARKKPEALHPDTVRQGCRRTGSGRIRDLPLGEKRVRVSGRTRSERDRPNAFPRLRETGTALGLRSGRRTSGLDVPQDRRRAQNRVLRTGFPDAAGALFLFCLRMTFPNLDLTRVRISPE